MVDVIINSLNGLTAYFDILYKTYNLDRFDSIYESNIDVPLGHVAAGIGASGDTLKLVFALLLAFPFAFFHGFLPNPTIKHLYNIVGGFIMLVFCYGVYGWVHVFLASLGAYALMAVFKTRAPPMVYVWTFAYLLCMMWYRMYLRFGEYVLDNTTPQMMLTIRLCQVAFNYKDGNVEASQKRPEFVPYQIKALPSLLELMSYAFYYGGVIMGPCYEYTEFIQFNNLTLFEQCPGKKVPSPYLATFVRFSAAVSLLVLHFLFKAYFPPDYLFDPIFSERSFLYKAFFSMCALQGVRFGYHFTFCLSEAPNILNGFGYNGVDEKTKRLKWDRLASANVTATEFAQAPFEISSNWNITAGHWLKYYVYLRLDSPNVKPKDSSATITNLVSALWHGFYPGYFIHFGTASMVLQVGRAIRAKLRERVVALGSLAKQVYDFLGFFFIKFFMGYSMACFYGLTWPKCSNYLFSMNFAGHIFLVVVYIIVMLIPPPPKKPVTETPTVSNGKKND